MTRSYPTAEAAFDHLLVLEALGIEAVLIEEQTGWSILVPPHLEKRAEQELRAFDADEAAAAAARLTPPPTLPTFPPSLWPSLVWALALMAGYACQISNPHLTEHGLASSIAILREHAWWRVLTALLLHADLPHLLGNILFGSLFIAIATRVFGPASSLALTLAAGTLGNAFAVAWHYPADVRSLGASTAVFACLGLLAGHGSAAGLRAPRSVGRTPPMVPLVSGFILLGWLGAGGENVDVVGHGFGFLAGTLVGAPIGFRQAARLDPLKAVDGASPTR